MIIQTLCNSYKKDILDGLHLSNHVYKIALFSSSANLNKNTESYIGLSDELLPEGGYEMGGKQLENRQVLLINDVAVVNFLTNPIWANATFIVRGALIYNDSLPDKNAIGVLDFGQEYNIVNQNFEIDFPASGENTSLIRII